MLAPDGTLYAGGSRPSAAGAPVRSAVVLRWNGATWDEIAPAAPPANTPPGGGVSVSALAVGPDGRLYAGGSFTTLNGQAAAGLARWDGAAWEALPPGAGSVGALVFASDGSLYTAGNVTGHIRRWDGNAWHTLGMGLGSSEGFGTYASDLAVAADGSLYVSGSFDRAGGVAVRNVARWSGATWHDVGGGIPEQPYPEVFALAAAPGGGVYVGGAFERVGELHVAHVAHWDGGAWRSLGGPGTDEPIRALLAASDGSVYAGGSFTAIGGVFASGLARWDGAAWQAVADLDGDVTAMTHAPNGDLYIAGTFETVGSVAARGVARWDGAAWHAIGSGIFGPVYALAVAPDGTLYAGGGFGTAGGVSVNRVARWTGSAWGALGQGVGGSGGPIVWALAVTPDGALYAGGSFTYAGSTVSPNLARWTGTAWQEVSTPASVAGAEVFALATAPDGALIVGGLFEGNVGRLDGAGWSVVGGGTNQYVEALAFDRDGRLYAGGAFTSAGGQAASRVAYHDGTAWHAVGAGVTGGSVQALASTPGVLYAGGSFTAADGTPALYVARATGLPVAAEDPAPAARLALAVGPNPLRDHATARFALPDAAAVRLALYDVLGREVAVLAEDDREAGAHEAAIAAGGLAPGIYVLRLSVGAAHTSQRLIVAR